MTRVSHALDRLGVSFDDPNLVANAGLLLTGTLSSQLDLEAMIDATVKLTGRVGGARPGSKVLTLTHSTSATGPAAPTSRARFAGELSIRHHDTRFPSSFNTTTTDRCRCKSIPTYDPM